MKVFSSRWVVPVAAPPQRDGAVAVADGRIVAVGARAEVVAAAGAVARHVDLGDAVILPGLVNAHVHIELSWLGTEPPALGDYTRWLRELLARRQDARQSVRQAAAAAAAAAIASMLARGTVAVGDVGNDGTAVPALAASALYGVAFLEIYGLNGTAAERQLGDAAQRLDVLAATLRECEANGRLRVALTPHAPHTTGPALLRALAGRAAASGDPLTVHAAESAAEVDLLATGEGPLAELFREREFLPRDWLPPRRSPIELLRRHGALSSRTLVVHAVHLDQYDRSALQSSGATVVSCPRSNAALGVGVAAVPQMLREGIPVALGTDSLASAPDLDLFAEMAALCAAHPALKPATVLRMATLNGARALGLGERLGTIETGKLAELIVVPLPTSLSDPLQVLCSLPERVARLEDAAP